MRFLADHDVYRVTAEFMIGLGHDVIRVAEIGLETASDQNLLTHAQREQRIFLTRDRDFGELVFIKAIRSGVVYLRVSPGTIAPVHTELERVLTLYSEQELLSSFVVVEPARHRIRRLLP